MSDFSSCTSFVMVTDGNSFVMEDDAETFSMTGSNGTTDYTKLQNKPSINGVTLEGNKTSEELGLLTEDDIAEAVDPIKEDLGTKAPVVTKTNGADFLDGADMPMKSLVVNIEPQQDLHGYDAPWAGGNGKNLFDQDTCTTGKYIAPAGYIADWTTAEYSDYIAVTAGQQYIFSGMNKTGADGSTIIHGYDSSKAWVQQIAVEAVSDNARWNTSFIVPEGISFIRVSTGYPLPDGQLEKGSTATSYQPYANICPITGWTGLNGSVVGKNWLPNNLTFTDGLRNDTGAQTASNVSHYSEPFSVRPNALYRATGTIWISGTNPRIYFLDANKNWISRTAQFTQQAFNFTTPTNCYYIQVQCSKDVDLTAGMISLDQSAAVTPYNGNTFSISWETEAGTVYSGTVDPIKGTLTVDKKGITFDGSEDEAWNMVTASSRAYIAVPDIITTVPDSGIVDLKSNQYKADGYNYSGRTRITGRYNIAQINVFDYNILVGSNYSELLAKWQAHLSEHPLQVIYPLATPIVYTLTPTEIRSLLGENHVTVDAGSIESLVYCVDTAAIIERIDADLDSLDGRVDTLESEMDTAQGDITSLETAVDKKAPAIYSTASGEVASFADGADDMPMTSLVATIVPKQNLNGYDHPWVGGAEKNKCPPKFTSRIVNGVTFTVSGEIFTANGTATDLTDFGTTNFSIPAGTYILSGCTGGSSSTYRLNIYGNGILLAQSIDGDSTQFTVASGDVLTFHFYVNNGTTVTNLVVKPMIRLASVSDSTYEPYENICPIEGYTGMTVRRDKYIIGFEQGGLRDVDGLPAAVNTRIRTGAIPLDAIPNDVNDIVLLYRGNLNIVLRSYYWFNADNTLVGKTGTAGPLMPINKVNIPSGATYFRIVLQCSDETLNIAPDGVYVDINPSDPIEVSWQTEAGTVYSGTVDAVSGKLVVDKAFKQYNGATEEHWSYSYWTKENTLAAYSNVYVPGAKIPAQGSYMFITECNCLPLKTYSQLQNEDVPGITVTGVALPSVRIPKTIASTVGEWMAYLASHPLEIVYELASPIEYQLPHQQIKTLYAENHVWTDVGEVSITYPTDTKLYVDNLFSSIPTASGVSF